MPEITIRHIDRFMAERIKVLAKERQWSTNDVVLQALRHGLGVSESAGLLAETARESVELSAPDAQWNANEQAAFQEAMQAFAMARSEQLVAAGK
ncbi:hypothetical protein ISP15_04905 [Dyella jejuensis]|uniref:Uncharacterized protein n=1 Tax=Dyella jejuensis TaxID=1432009 RepID=A0ABW8JEZ9_9GAMM